MVAAGVLLAATTLTADAHVVVEPSESPAGQTQLYTLAVPSESTSDTVRIEAQFPRSVVVLQLAAPPGWQVTPEADGAGHILGAIWDGGRTPPGQLVELGVLAQNAEQSSDVSLSWAVIQTYADGREAQWIGPPTSQFPAAQTRLRGGGLGVSTAEMLPAAALVCSLAALILSWLTWRRGRGATSRSAQAEAEAAVEADAAPRPLATG
jgi:Domain of unkown function (DUF1775)